MGSTIARVSHHLGVHEAVVKIASTSCTITISPIITIVATSRKDRKVISYYKID